MSSWKDNGSELAAILAAKGLDGSGNERWMERLGAVSGADVERELSRGAGVYSLERLAVLLSPAAQGYLEEMARQANQLTIQRFGRTIKLYAPLYVSNYCCNKCSYCGFHEDSGDGRTRLSVEEAVRDAEVIAGEGFRDLLIVSGEDSKFVTVDYLAELAGRLRGMFSVLSLEIHQLETDEYAKLFRAGYDGVTIYQETYDGGAYEKYHLGGPKADYQRRLAACDSIAQAGMREIGIGALLGLNEWRTEALALGEHGHYLTKRYWQSHVSFSFCRLRPAHEVADEFSGLLSDAELVQMILAFRLCFSDAGLTLSTRERSEFRDNLMGLGITRMSAGSKTNPGGYAGEGDSVEQFEISDDRSAGEVAEVIKSRGYEAVWKDWDAAFTG